MFFFLLLGCECGRVIFPGCKITFFFADGCCQLVDFCTFVLKIRHFFSSPRLFCQVCFFKSSFLFRSLFMGGGGPSFCFVRHSVQMHDAGLQPALNDVSPVVVFRFGGARTALPPEI